MSPILQAAVDAIVTIPGAASGIPFQTITGGEQTSDTVKDRLPGQQFETAIPAPPSLTNLVVGRTWDEAAFGPIISKIRAAHAAGTVCAVARVRRDGRGNIVGRTTYNAILVRVTEAEGDTTSSDKARLELEFNPTGPPS
jgi:hypothetical protein